MTARAPDRKPRSTPDKKPVRPGGSTAAKTKTQKKPPVRSYHRADGVPIRSSRASSDKSKESRSREAKRSAKERRRRDRLAAETAGPAAHLAARQKARRTRRLIFRCLLLTAMAALISVLSVTIFFKIEEVRVTGDSIYTKEEILTLCRVQPGENLMRADTKGIEKRLTDSLPYLKTVKVRRRLPSVLEITVEPDHAVFMTELNGVPVLLSGEFKVLEQNAAKPAGVLKVRGIGVQNQKVGEKLVFTDESMPERLQELLYAVQKEKLADAIDCADLSKLYAITLEMKGKYSCVLGMPEDFPAKLRLAAVIMDDPDCQRPGTIDVSDVRRGRYVPDEEE